MYELEVYSVVRHLLPGLDQRDVIVRDRNNDTLLVVRALPIYGSAARQRRARRRRRAV